MRKAFAFVLAAVIAISIGTLGAQRGEGQGRGRGGAAAPGGGGRGPGFPPDPSAADAEARPKPMAGTIERLDPALDQIVSSDAKLEMLKENYFGISEGPVWIQEGGQGYLLFSDIACNCIYKWMAPGTLSIFMRNSGFTGNNGTPVGFVANSGHLLVANIGSNGITVDPEGRLVFTAQGDRAIIRIEKDGTRTVLADKFQGKRLNRPNDVIVKSDGSVYFSDPYPMGNPSIEIMQQAIYRIKNGTVDVIAKDVPVNGLAFSPDEKVFYIAAGGLAAYDVQPDGTVTNRRSFVDMTVDKRPGNPDGMKVDTKGNVYTGGPGGIWVISPAGKHLGTITLPINPTNLAFGDADAKMLYITDRLHLVRIKLNVAGIIPGPHK